MPASSTPVARPRAIIAGVRRVGGVRRGAALVGQEAGADPDTPHPDAWVEEWAAHLHSVVDGLALQLMVTPGATDADDVRRRLRAFLARAAEAHEYRTGR